MRFAPAAVIASLGALSACSLLTDLDGNTGGVRDAGAGVGDAAEADAPDGSAPVSGDASATDSSAQDAGCAPGYGIALCDDFARSQPLGNGWDEVGLSGSGVLTIANGALKASTGAATSGPEGIAALRKALKQEVGRILVEVRVQFDALPTLDNEYRLLWGISMASSGGQQLVYFSAYPGRLALVFQDQTVPPPYPLEFYPVTLSPGPTYRIRTEVAVGGRARVLVDGAQVVDVAMPSFFKRGTPGLGLGILTSPQPTSAFAVSEDDFVFGAD